MSELLFAGKALPSDEVAADPAGPWTELARLNLTDAPPAEVRDQLPAKRPPAELIVPASPGPASEGPRALPAAMRVAGTIATAMFSGTMATGKAIGHTLSTRSQRKHELKLARIQATAVEGQGRARAAAALPPAAAGGQSVSQTTIVKVYQDNSGASGCVGCLALCVIGVVVVAIFGSRDPSTPTSTVPAAAPAMHSPATSADEPREISQPLAADEQPQADEEVAADEPQESAAERQERRARGSLDLGKSFYRQGQSEKGQRWLQDLIRDYAGTQAAVDAQGILDGRLKP